MDQPRGTGPDKGAERQDDGSRVRKRVREAL